MKDNCFTILYWFLPYNNIDQYLADFYWVWLHPRYQAWSQGPLGSPGHGEFDPETSVRHGPWGAARRQVDRGVLWVWDLTHHGTYYPKDNYMSSFSACEGCSHKAKFSGPRGDRSGKRSLALLSPSKSVLPTMSTSSEKQSVWSQVILQKESHNQNSDT